MNEHFVRVLAGEGQDIWDVSSALRLRGMPLASEIWHAKTIRHIAEQSGGTPVATTKTASGDPLSQLSLQMATELVKTLDADQRTTMGVILGTHFGCLRTDMEFDTSRRQAAGRYASPAAFRGTLPTTIPAELSVKLGLRGPVLAVSAQPDSLATAIHRAQTWMRHLHMPLCLTGGFDWPAVGEPRALLILLTKFGVMD